MTETPSPPSITVEGGERIQFSAQVESQAVAGQAAGVGGSAGQGGERSEPDRSGGTANSGGAAPTPIPDPEVPEKPKRRQFTAEYKRSIVAQAEACRDDGAIGALLRREGCIRPISRPGAARRSKANSMR